MVQPNMQHRFIGGVLSCIAGGATPAPGDYDVADPSAAAAPAWTMGTNTAGADAAAALDQQLQPGPGHYTPSDPVRDGRGVAASIGGKWKEATATGSDGPAPGEYEVPAGKNTFMAMRSHSCCILCVR